MTKNDNNVLATIEFVADKMLPKMKKCLDKKGKYEYCEYPAIEMRTGLMIATTGHILTVHKLKDYSFCPSDGALLSNVVVLPMDVLTMKGKIVVTVKADAHKTIVTVTDGTGAVAIQEKQVFYPEWHNVVPKETGWPIDVNAKVWDGVLKDIMPNLTFSKSRPVRLSCEGKSDSLSVSWEDYDRDNRGSKDVYIGFVPYRISVMLKADRLRDILAFQPTAMRFISNSMPVFFHNDETICLIMPLLGCDVNACSVDKNYIEGFDLDKWIGVDLGKIVVDNREPTKELTSAEKLRAALLQKFRQAA